MSDFAPSRQKHGKKIPVVTSSSSILQPVRDFAPEGATPVPEDATSLDWQAKVARAEQIGHSISSIAIHRNEVVQQANSSTRTSIGESPLQLQSDTQTTGAAETGEQREENRTGLPDALKDGVERLSGYSLSDIRVHYNSPEPAEADAQRQAQQSTASGEQQAWRTQGLFPVASSTGFANGGFIQRMIDKKAVKEKLGQQHRGSKKDVVLSVFASVLTTTVLVQTRDGTFVKRKLSQLSRAQLAQVIEQANGTGADIIKFKADKSKGEQDPSPQADAVAEAEATMEFLTIAPRTGEGGGLFQSTSDQQFAFMYPPYSPHREGELAETNQGLDYFDKPTDMPDLMMEDISTPPKLMHTASGTELPYTNTFSYTSPSKQEYNIHFYAKGAEDQKPRLVQTPGTAVATGLKTASPAVKSAGPVVIDRKKLNEWAGQRGGHKPDQNAAMDGVSAKDEATQAGYDGTLSWQWLHLIAFTFGGINGSQPNEANNLVAGLAAANGQHLVLENLVKKLILTDITKQVTITATATMAPPSHVATHIDYQLEWTDDTTKQKQSQKYSIDPLSPNKPMGGQFGVLFNRVAVSTADLGERETDYVSGIAKLQRGEAVGGTAGAQAAEQDYQKTIAALQAGKKAGYESRAVQAARDDYEEAIKALQAGTAIGPSTGAQAAKNDYEKAIQALQAGTEIGLSTAAQAAKDDYKEAMKALQAGTAIGSSIAAQAAKDDYDRDVKSRKKAKGEEVHA